MAVPRTRSFQADPTVTMLFDWRYPDAPRTHRETAMTHRPVHLLRCAGITLLIPMALSAAETWHVATSGSDDGAGSAAKPFRSIQRAAEQAGPGDTVLVHAGTYRETVKPKRSGEAGQPITYRPATGESVVISGADPVTGWSVDQGKVWKAAMPGDFYRSSIN